MRAKSKVGYHILEFKKGESIMKTSKKTLSLILAMALCAGLLAGCGGGGQSADPSAPAQSAAGGGETVQPIVFTVTADVTGARAPYVDRFAELISEKTEGRYQADVIAAASL